MHEKWCRGIAEFRRYKRIATIYLADSVAGRPFKNSLLKLTSKAAAGVAAVSKNPAESNCAT